MNRKEFLDDEWAAAMERWPGIDVVAAEAKSRFDCDGVLMILGKRKAEPEAPKYVEPFKCR